VDTEIHLHFNSLNVQVLYLLLVHLNQYYTWQPLWYCIKIFHYPHSEDTVQFRASSHQNQQSVTQPEQGQMIPSLY